MDPLIEDAQASTRRRSWAMRYAIARNPAEAFTASEDVRIWLEELACLPNLGFDGEHCVVEALRDLRTVRTYLRQLARNPA
jgi:hypothetical protein